MSDSLARSKIFDEALDARLNRMKTSGNENSRQAARYILEAEKILGVPMHEMETAELIRKKTSAQTECTAIVKLEEEPKSLMKLETPEDKRSKLVCLEGGLTDDATPEIEVAEEEQDEWDAAIEIAIINRLKDAMERNRHTEPEIIPTDEEIEVLMNPLRSALHLIKNSN